MAAPVYLLTGPEIGERNDYIEKLKADVKKRFGASDDYLFYAADTRVQDVVARLRTESLFCPATVIVLRGAEQIKLKDDIALLGEWVASVTPSAKNTSPAESSVLILVSDAVSVDAKLEKLVPKEHKKIFWELFEERKEAWVQNFFRKNGYAIDADAVDTVLAMVENNTEELRNECGRFFLCFPQDHVITGADVEQLLAHNREESAFTLFDAMADADSSVQKRLEGALQILQKILLTKNGNAVMLIAGLASCFRRLLAWHRLHAHGAYADDITLRQNGFAGKTIRAQYARAARVWTQGQAAGIVALLSKTDMEIRALGTAFVETQLTLMVYEIVVKRGAYTASYEVA
ncbi:MAG: DNA polymerase III subunit delta [Treponema sp.]|nr:DNA polymerase III subunit delta [Treponema sp.]